ncbi:MAG TPA: heterodisulfide reductase-related iron-sulfur binding cluster [Rubrivivax sp.]|nr:heterodisulfide reductase-related iron-sulfur binding cluster [Rubrivivax sp.]
MDGQQVRLWESRCIEELPPACTAACPVHLDVRGLAVALRKGGWSAAHALLCRYLPFPGIVGHLCEHPCETPCRRAEAGGAIRINALERAVARHGPAAPSFRRGRAQEKKRVAVVGAGLSGLTVAADLIVKGHELVVFEAGPQPLARLRADPRLPAAALEADLARFENTGIDLRLHEKADVAALVAEFDAVYLGTGNGQATIAVDPLTHATDHPKVFAGGSLRYGEPYAVIASLADGRHAALSIERLLQGASLTANRDNQGSQPSRLYVNTARHAPAPPVPASADGYSIDEAQAEAGRCFPCHCLECVQVCSYLEHYKAYPKRYIREIYNNETIVMGARKSNRMIDSCTLCGLCAEVCPEQLGMGEVCLSARQGMVASKHMPPSHHDFALRDLAFSRSEAFTLARHQSGHASSAVVFYPGCQLAASAPEQVERIYAHLSGRITGGVGLMLGCCGAPAHWAARGDLFDATRAEFRAAWQSLGAPRVVTACSSCWRMFSDHQPGVQLQSLWVLLETIGLPPGAESLATLAIHDPCTTRHEPDMQASVRRIAAQRGATVVELDGARNTTCCGFGGLAQFANPEVADKIVDRRVQQDEAPYLTYCAMCRDNFARRGKPAVHLLDLLYPSDGAAARPDPGFSRRQENRGRLKRHLLRELWRQDVEEPGTDIQLVIAPEVHADLERKLILHDDLRQVIRHAERSGEFLLDPATGRRVASHRPVHISYWVEYTLQEGRCVVHRAYSHRMEVSRTP